MRLEQIVSLANLKLSWRRITTGANYQYRRYFRDLYYAYEIAIDKNLRDFQERLKGGASYHPKAPTRIYIPKPSGLQRPLTLLSIEDQILLQAITNIFALKLAHRRKRLQLKTVFSNILQDKASSIFFLKDWHETYGEFEIKIRSLYTDGLRWIAHFDLAAFYDTISHDLLLHTVSPKSSGSETKDIILNWLKVWSAEKSTLTYGHGIPQGPIASDFLAECFLLPIDEVLSKEFSYVRYVDDIRIFASSKMEVQKAAIRLEVLCRERGLIPQGKKFTIAEARSVDDALGMLPSIAPPDNEKSEQDVILPARRAVKRFQESLEGNAKRIADKSRARYVLYHAEPSAELLDYVLRLLPIHPEHIDAFVYYLGHYKKSNRIIRVCKDYLRETPYDYVQGEIWHTLARMMSRNEMRSLIKEAVNIAKNSKNNFSVKWGACHFLCKTEHAGLGNYSKFVNYQKSALLQALLVPILPGERYKKGNVVTQMLKRSSYEPGLMLSEQLVRRKLTHLDFDIKTKDLPNQVQNVFRAVGIIQRGRGVSIDPIGEILTTRYLIKKWTGWKVLLGSEYVHAFQLLSQADPVFDSGRSRWLSYQNSFNHSLLLALQQYLKVNNLNGVVKTVGRDGKLIKFGTLVDVNQPFSKNWTIIAKAFREANCRRNTLPGNHPYEAKGGARTQHLKKGEQGELAKKLAGAYAEIISNFDGLHSR